VSSEIQGTPSDAGRQVAFWLVAARVGIRRKRLVGWTALTIVVVAAATALLLPPHYTSTAVLLPPPESGSLGTQLMAQLSSAGGVAALGASAIGAKNPNDLQVALLRSRTVEDAMVDHFHLQEIYHRGSLSSTRRAWERATAVDNGLKDGLIRLSVTDRDPSRASKLAAGWVEEYKRFAATLAVTDAARRRTFLEQELDGARASLAQAEEEMKQTEQRTGVITLQGQASAMITSAALLRGQVAAKEVEIRSMRQFAGDENPNLQRKLQELAALQSQLAAMDVSHDRPSGDLVAPRGIVAQSGLDYARALREVKYRETVVELLGRLYEAAAVDEARNGPLIQVVDAPAVPDKPSSLYRVWIFVCAAICAFPLALIAALVVEVIAILRTRRQHSASWAAVLEGSWYGGRA
jgi:tyrosine-protein kinase Etk/Wzc